jgi:hypothetical protein
VTFSKPRERSQERGNTPYRDRPHPFKRQSRQRKINIQRKNWKPENTSKYQTD